MEEMSREPGGMAKRLEKVRSRGAEYLGRLRGWLGADDDEEPMFGATSDVSPVASGMPTQQEGSRFQGLRERFVSCGRTFCREYRRRAGGLSSGQRLAILFVAAVIVGVGIKYVATQYVTMGYYDYTAGSGETYDIVALTREAIAEGGEASASIGTAGGSCAQ